MNYEKLSNRKLHQLIQLREPALLIYEVNETNRNTVIAFLKVSNGIAFGTGDKRLKGSAM